MEQMNLEELQVNPATNEELNKEIQKLNQVSDTQTCRFEGYGIKRR